MCSSGACGGKEKMKVQAGKRGGGRDKGTSRSDREDEDAGSTTLVACRLRSIEKSRCDQMLRMCAGLVVVLCVWCRCREDLQGDHDARGRPVFEIAPAGTGGGEAIV